MLILDQRLPTAAGSVDILAKDKNGAIVMIALIDSSDGSPFDKCLKCYDFVTSNRKLLERFYQGIDSKKIPRIVLVAQRFTESVISLAKDSMLNLEGLLELKEYYAVQIPGGAQSIIFRPLDLATMRNVKIEGKPYAAPQETSVNGTNGKDVAYYLAIGKNTAMVAHDLKTPLQVLMNSSYNARQSYESSDLLTKKAIQDVGLGSLLDTIDKQIDYINKMISELQSMYVELTPKIAEASLAELLKDVTTQIPSNIKLDLEIGFDMASFDYYLMKRALSNLVINALQAMPNGGALVIKTIADGESAVVQIQDTGVGIPKDVLQNLFSTFTTTKSNGTGMGLISAKRAVDAHNGTISVNSEEGKGTTVIIKIPRHK
jgi:signal transduction histidine kinase